MTQPGSEIPPPTGWFRRSGRVGAISTQYGWTTEVYGANSVRGTIAAELVAVRVGIGGAGLIETGTVAATTKKLTAALVGQHIQTGSITSSIKKLTASISGEAFNPVYYTDDFNRDNSATSAGPDWTNVNNVLGISGNTCYAPGLYGVATYGYSPNSNNHRVSLTVSANHSTTRPSFLFMGCGSDIKASARIFNNKIEILTRTTWAGTPTVRATYTGTVSNGDVISLGRWGSVFSIRQNDIERITWDDSDEIVTRDASHRICAIGVSRVDAISARVDDWVMEDLY